MRMTMSRWRWNALALPLILVWAPAHSADAAALAELKSQLYAIVAEYEPGTPVTPEMDAKVSEAAKALEEAAGVPDLNAQATTLDGTWLNIYDTRNLAYQVNLKFMSGGVFPDTLVPVRMTTQELRPSAGFYRNTMIMEAGAEKVPFHYIATAGLGVNADKANVVDVSFKSFEFVPSDARYSGDDLRAALQLEPDTPLVLTMPEGGPPSNSIVTYLDDELRINRGATTPYIAVMKKLK
jgi:hypothetical protein